MRPGESVISLISVALFVFVSSATPPTPTPTPTQMLPSRVQGVTVTRTVQGLSPALSVSWSAVSGSGITYTVCYVTVTTNSTLTICDASGITGTSTTLGPLSPGTTYIIWVRAVSSVGEGPYSYGRRHRTYQTPVEICNPTVTKVVRSGIPALRVTWTAPFSERPITEYQVQYRTSVCTCWRGKNVASTSTTLENLSAGTSYQVQVRAVSDVGVGPYSEIRTMTTYEVPSAPANIRALSSTTTLTVRWNEGFNYKIYLQKKGSTEISTFGPVTPHYNITGLESNTEYTVVVEAYNSLGSANRSVVGYTLPEIEHIKTNRLIDADSDTSSVGLSAGLFFAGLVSGIITLLLVEGIIWGACKIRSNQKLIKLSNEGIYNIPMADCPAYVSNDREDKTAGEYH